MSRLRQNLIYGTITNNPLTNVGTTLNSTELADLIAITGSDDMLITLDPEGTYGDPEIVRITAHTASATSATIVRNELGTLAREHVLGTRWTASAYTVDLVANTVGASMPAYTYDGARAYVTDAARPTGSFTPNAAIRPATPGDYIYDARWNPPFNGPWGILDIAKGTTVQSGITTIATDLTSLSVTFTHSPGRWVELKTIVPVSKVTTDGVEVQITDASNAIQNKIAKTVNGSAIDFLEVYAYVTTTGSAVTYKTRMFCVSGSVGTNVAATQYASLTATDIGPSGQPS